MKMMKAHFIGICNGRKRNVSGVLLPEGESGDEVEHEDAS